jgi:hypothetical protein
MADPVMEDLMYRGRLVVISSALVAGLMAGACGSAARSGSTSATATTSPDGKLDLAVAPGGAATAAGSAGAAIFPVRPTKYVVDAKLADLGVSAAAWRMQAHAMSIAAVQRFAGVLGLAAAPVRTSAGWQVQGANAMLSVAVNAGSATVSYASGTPGSTGGSAGSAGTSTSPGAVVNGPPSVAPPVDVPDAADAISIARGLLDRLGVLAGQEWSTVVSDSGGVAVTCAVGVPCPAVPAEVFARTVVFSLMLRGTRVSGPDWSVTIGEHRRIETMNCVWAAPASIGSYPLRSTAAVFTDLQLGTAKYAGPQPMTAMSGAPAVGAPTIVPASPARTIPAVTVHVTGVSLGVARWDAYDNGRPVVDLVPTYRFHARVDGGSPYDIEVLALEPGAVTFTNPIPTPKPLPAQPAPASPPMPDSIASPPSS